jgi:hypothetical protein
VGNGAFTRALLDGLSGKADRDKRSFVDTEELSSYVRFRVLDIAVAVVLPFLTVSGRQKAFSRLLK